MNHNFGTGHWYNEKTKEVHQMDPNSLGPHGDHDGWLTIGDHAEKLGVDPKHAKAFQHATYGFMIHDHPAYKKLSEHADSDGYVDPHSVPSREIDPVFKEVHGTTHSDAMVKHLDHMGHLWRVRHWTRGHTSIDGQHSQLPEHEHFKHMKHVAAMLHEGGHFKGVKSVGVYHPNGHIQTTPETLLQAKSYKDLERNSQHSEVLQFDELEINRLTGEQAEAILKERHR